MRRTHVISFFACAAMGFSQSLVDAVKSQNTDTVKALLEKRVDVNTREADGTTALHWAAHRDSLVVVEMLLKAGADPNSADDHGTTALALACTNRNAALVEKLTVAGANANATTTNGETPLMTCARAGSADGVSILLAHGASINAKENLRGQTALMWAVAQKHPDVVKVLLDKGADVHARSNVSEQLIVRDGSEVGARLVCPPGTTEESRRKATYTLTPDATGKIASAVCAIAELLPKGGSTALLFAARNGDIESAKVLLAGGANVNDVAPDGNSALVQAAYSGQSEFASFLLDRDARPNADGGGYGAMHAAVLRGDLALVKALIAHGGNPNLRLTKGTPVLRDNVDLHLQGALRGATPFFLAAKFAEVEIMRALLAAGADPLLGIDDGTTPLMAAAGVGWRVVANTRRGTATTASVAPPADDDAALEAVKMILDRGGNVNSVNSNNETALHGAAAAGYAPVIQLLVDKGARVDLKNKNGKTALALTIVDPEQNKGRHDLSAAQALLRKLTAEAAPQALTR